MMPAMIQPAVMKALIFGILAALAAQSPSGLVTQRTLSLGLAKTMADAALAECKAKGFNTSVVVVDRAGQTIVALRDENASAQTMEMARRKAYTARMFRLPTLEFQKRTEEPKYKAQRDVADILALGGGVPIVIAGAGRCLRQGGSGRVQCTRPEMMISLS
jgi:uncharacterized protein GlcG (DUF336 family)